jgi:hypothetical protein
VGSNFKNYERLLIWWFTVGEIFFQNKSHALPNLVLTQFGRQLSNDCTDRLLTCSTSYTLCRGRAVTETVRACLETISCENRPEGCSNSKFEAQPARNEHPAETQSGFSTNPTAIIAVPLPLLSCSLHCAKKLQQESLLVRWVYHPNKRVLVQQTNVSFPAPLRSFRLQEFVFLKPNTS